MPPRPPGSTLFPYTTLFRSEVGCRVGIIGREGARDGDHAHEGNRANQAPVTAGLRPEPGEDRKSTRLNSSHRTISYAVFCLKKKKNQATTRSTVTRETHLRN